MLGAPVNGQFPSASYYIVYNALLSIGHGGGIRISAFGFNMGRTAYVQPPMRESGHE